MQANLTMTDKRDLKALDLIHAGKVHLILGQKFGLVDGSKGQSYTTSRDGCSCPDWTNRQVKGGCCHMRALRTVCTLYKTARAEARETGRTRLPWAVGLALRPITREDAPAASVPTYQGPAETDRLLAVYDNLYSDLSAPLGYCDRCGRPGVVRCGRGQHFEVAA